MIDLLAVEVDKHSFAFVIETVMRDKFWRDVFLNLGWDWSPAKAAGYMVELQFD